MKALAWHGKRDVRVDNVPDPTIQEPTDAVIRVTTTAICGSDLHLYEVLTPFMPEGLILGHEPMGAVEEVGSGVTNLSVGDRVVIPFQVSCGHCFMCERGLQTQCEITQVREEGMGAALFGYTKLYGNVLGLGPIGDMSSRIAKHLGFRVIAVDLVPERIERARRNGIEVLDLNEHDDVAGEIREMTDGRGTDSVIDAVGMEAHGSPGVGLAQQMTTFMPDSVAEMMMEKAGADRLNAFYMAIDAVRRGGTISLS